ncbi:hypothetical protein ZIOFF_043148 [Zingiber officinale]|uniref:Uncharacterized protein n=1 Tax=Zingiber officinale TaxID=94328 RepID=A0A8J5FUR6_ZINOF|nr:hypothetical protein ZIOFF_043148 [Zingiber officinale]
MNVWDPYQRLGMSHDASEEEILEAQNFLLKQYGGQESSYESIEAAFEKILMANFRKRKRDAFEEEILEAQNFLLKQYGGHESSYESIEASFEKILTPMWSVMNSSETGPAFQWKVVAEADAKVVSMMRQSSTRWVLKWRCRPIHASGSDFNGATRLAHTKGNVRSDFNCSVVTSLEMTIMEGPLLVVMVALSLLSCIYFLNDDEKCFESLNWGLSLLLGSIGLLGEYCLTSRKKYICPLEKFGYLPLEPFLETYNLNQDYNPEEFLSVVPSQYFIKANRNLVSTSIA